MREGNLVATSYLPSEQVAYLLVVDMLGLGLLLNTGLGARWQGYSSWENQCVWVIDA